MATTTISLTITTPTGVTISDAVGLLGRRYNYQKTLADGTANPQKEADYIKSIIAQNIASEIYNQQRSEQVEALTAPAKITVS